MKKTKISQICIYLDCKADESYTPSKIAIKGGMHMQDLKVVLDLMEGDKTDRAQRPTRLVHHSSHSQALKWLGEVI